jgi:hypothetical protein
MILALLVPVAVYGAKVGWSLDRDAMAEKREKALGWHIVAASVLGCIASAVMIAIVTQDQNSERTGDGCEVGRCTERDPVPAMVDGRYGRQSSDECGKQRATIVGPMSTAGGRSVLYQSGRHARHGAGRELTRTGRRR